jgi:GDPmannose 4,6-dehydratase
LNIKYKNMKNKNALITGITGQDGSFLAELLISKGYNVFGFHRRLSSNDLNCSTHLVNKIKLIEGDMCDRQSLLNAIKVSRPHEIYNLASQSHVGASFIQPNYTFDVNGRGVLYLLEAVKESGINCKIYQAATSEQFGGVPGTEPQNEKTPFIPKSPYAIAKLYAFETVRFYRDAYNLFICNGICFNHESERRGKDFISRKISDGVARIYHKLQNELRLGNLDAKRDWGYAKEYVEGMWLMLQQDEPDDYVLATGEMHSVREMCDISFKYVNLDYNDYVISDSEFLRNNEVNILQGDPTKANQVLGWKSSTSFNDLMRLMVKFDCEKYDKLNN